VFQFIKRISSYEKLTFDVINLAHKALLRHGVAVVVMMTNQSDSGEEFLWPHQRDSCWRLCKGIRCCSLVQKSRAQYL